MQRNRYRVAILIAALVAGCGVAVPSPETPAASATRPGMPASAVPDAARDLDLLRETLEATHPDPYHAVSRDRFTRALDEVETELPTLTPAASVVELMRVWAMLARERDGHQFAFPVAGVEEPMLPIRVYEFAEGVYITDALDADDLVGVRITAIGGRPIDEVLQLLEPLVPLDGPQTLATFRPIFLVRALVLEGLGIVPGGQPIDLTIEDAAGVVRTVALEPIPEAEHTAWAGQFGTYHLPHDPEVPYLADEAPFTVRDLDGGQVLYLRYRFVAPPDVGRARERVMAGVERLVLDLRQNTGGNYTTFDPLLALVTDFAAERPGSLAVITDRVTFSAASILATEIERRTDATFVGEPMGGAPSFWDDVTWLELRRLPVPMRFAISTVEHARAAPGDARLTIEPSILVPVTAADHFAGRDPTLEAALEATR